MPCKITCVCVCVCFLIFRWVPSALGHLAPSLKKNQQQEIQIKIKRWHDWIKEIRSTPLCATTPHHTWVPKSNQKLLMEKKSNHCKPAREGLPPHTVLVVIGKPGKGQCCHANSRFISWTISIQTSRWGR